MVFFVINWSNECYSTQLPAKLNITRHIFNGINAISTQFAIILRTSGTKYKEITIQFDLTKIPPAHTKGNF